MEIPVEVDQEQSTPPVEMQLDRYKHRILVLAGIQQNDCDEGNGRNASGDETGQDRAAQDELS
eukprot:750326-Hanusia_phi.AAC.4